MSRSMSDQNRIKPVIAHVLLNNLWMYVKQMLIVILLKHHDFFHRFHLCNIFSMMTLNIHFISAFQAAVMCMLHFSNNFINVYNALLLITKVLL